MEIPPFALDVRDGASTCTQAKGLVREVFFISTGCIGKKFNKLFAEGGVLVSSLSHGILTIQPALTQWQCTKVLGQKAKSNHWLERTINHRLNKLWLNHQQLTSAITDSPPGSCLSFLITLTNTSRLMLCYFLSQLHIVHHHFNHPGVVEALDKDDGLAVLGVYLQVPAVCVTFCVLCWSGYILKLTKIFCN